MMFVKGGLRGRRCLITGAAGGIGAAVARRFCEAGAAVAVSDLDGDAVERLARELADDGAAAHGLTLDVTSEAEVEIAVSEAARLLDGLDTLVANAGILTVDRLEETTLDAFRRTLDVNLVGTFLCARHAVGHLRAAGGGAIVCTASHAGIEGAPELSAYCASKFGVVGLVQVLARELAPDGIRVTAVAPGLVDTPMQKQAFERRAAIRGEDVGEFERRALEAVPIGRLATPDEVADAIAFLASDAASYISGVTLPLLGGELSR
jgi:NAD(P)-dependent dehydrogenase (short-subunit alcohol dehydrogenase family)